MCSLSTMKEFLHSRHSPPSGEYERPTHASHSVLSVLGVWPGVQREHLPEKNGYTAVAVIVPLKPASHTQSPASTSVPAESDGHPTAVHAELLKV